jgi:hypothetical protein
MMEVGQSPFAHLINTESNHHKADLDNLEREPLPTDRNLILRVVLRLRLKGILRLKHKDKCLVIYKGIKSTKLILRETKTRDINQK